MPDAINLTEYKMLHPGAAEFPTLSQGGLLRVLLAKQRRREVRLALRRARRQARRQAVRAWLTRCWASLRANASQPAHPAFAGAADGSWTRK